MKADTLSDLLAEARLRLAEAGLPEAANDTRHLVSGLLGLASTELLTRPERPVTAEERERVRIALARRIKREPVHRILGSREFYGLELVLSAETLEPRPDTEILVDVALPYLRQKPAARFVDFGTGTGAIALALLSECPECTGLGVDLSEDALATARANAQRLGLADRFTAVRSNWGADIHETFDLIVSNPPYIPTQVVSTLEPEVRIFDPLLALDGGMDGLDAYRSLAIESNALLAPGGVIVLEIGYDQKDSVTALFEGADFQRISATRDLGGQDRVLVFARSPSGKK